jgi:hypothetical protein
VLPLAVRNTAESQRTSEKKHSIDSADEHFEPNIKPIQIGSIVFPQPVK